MDLQQHVPGCSSGHRQWYLLVAGGLSNRYTCSCCSDKIGTFGATKPPPNPPTPTSDDDYVEKDPKGRYIRVTVQRLQENVDQRAIEEEIEDVKINVPNKHVKSQSIGADEICNVKSTEYTPTIDIWSIGCIFAELVTGKPLFPGKNIVHQLDLMTDMLGVPSPEAIARLQLISLMTVKQEKLNSKETS